ncbi:MAG TPA: hypothetical protein VF041_16305 [Gemmatimonadaceae bacterium]
MSDRPLNWRPLRPCIAALVAAASIGAAPAAHASGTGRPDRPAARDELVPWVRASRAVFPASEAIRALRARAIPGFSRQTKLACNVCHYGFPELTPFGRLFKLNGYTLTGLETIEARDSARESLKLAPFPPVSAMAIASVTHTGASVPGTQNNTAVFPDELSLFVAGELTPKLGAFVQLTYSAADAAVALDNTEFRFADRTRLFSKELLYGITLHNNPTMQDVWNTAPAWGFPFTSSGTAPTPMAGATIDDALGQQVLGLGAYAFWHDWIYAEFTAYRSAQQGVTMPLGADAAGVARHVIPYWRLAIQHQFGASYLMLGTFGLVAHLYPGGVTGPTDRYADVAADAQFERRIGRGVVIGRSTYIHESRTLDGLVAQDTPGAARRHGTLDVFRVSASYMPSLRLDISAGYFDTGGSRDAILYPAGDITGSATGSPSSNGGVGEVDFNAWQNARLGAQYVAYRKFNGASRSYDGAGRSASDNDTLFLFVWLAF